MDIVPQIVKAIAISVAVFFVYMVFETLYKAYLSYGAARIAVYPVTGSSSRTIVKKQDPSNPGNINLPMSENQLTGIEFSYSTFLYISDDTDDGQDQEGWKAIFYKGYEGRPYPLLGPGVFVSSSSRNTSAPTLRVVMNSYDTWYNTIDVKQIPFNKWFHLALVLRKNTMEVYVNGNLANKKSFAGSLPYQNYQPLILFPNVTTPTNLFKNESTESMKKRGIAPGDNFIVKGKFSGYISNMYYFSYAMSYSEIQAMLNMGPSSEFDQQAMDKPPYLIDSWWTQRKS